MWQHIAKQGTSSSTLIIHFYFPWILLKENCVHFVKVYIKIDQTLSLQVIKVGGTCFLVFFQMVGTEPISSYHKLVQTPKIKLHFGWFEVSVYLRKILSRAEWRT